VEEHAHARMVRRAGEGVYTVARRPCCCMNPLRGATRLREGSASGGGFTPVLTTLAFHADQDGGVVTSEFECFARVPGSGTGPGSAEFTVNAMYVTGRITGAVVSGDAATLTGTATITGLGDRHQCSH
jgi:hypothetical protein